MVRAHPREKFLLTNEPSFRRVTSNQSRTRATFGEFFQTSQNFVCCGPPKVPSAQPRMDRASFSPSESALCPMNSKCENGSVWRLFLCSRLQKLTSARQAVWRLFLCSRLQELTSAQQAVCSRVNCGCYKKRVTAVNSTVSFRHRANRVRSPSSAKARRWPGAAIGIVRSRVTNVPAPLSPTLSLNTPLRVP